MNEIIYMWMLIESDLKLFANTYRHNRILSVYHVRHNYIRNNEYQLIKNLNQTF